MKSGCGNLMGKYSPVIKRSSLTTASRQVYGLFMLIYIFFCLEGLLAETIFVNEFAVQVDGGETAAKQLADQYGFLYRGKIGSLEGFYLFEHHKIEKRSTVISETHHKLLQDDPQILWFEQQHIKRRVKREIVNYGHSLEFPDPLYPEQWFLHGGGNGGFDMNVLPAWKEGFTGKRIVVTILDDGIQTNHPDLAQNYDKMASLDINGRDDDPMPQDNDDNKHGTRCAGEVAAVAFNQFCGVGVAYNASIGGVRMLDGKVTDSTEATALSHNPHHIHIYSASWGPEDDGKTVDGPGPLAIMAFEEGIRKGRSGLGSLFIWASGNGGRYFDSCSCDGYANSIYTLSISSATQAGAMPWYLEQCSSTLATTYSSGTASKDKSIATVDMNTSFFHGTGLNSLLCTTSHTGTSASAPIAAGMCALALEANPNLTWRDMQYIVLMTSRPDPLKRENGWVQNGVERMVSPKFGYGLMDAFAMVKLAQKWQTVPEQHMCETPADNTEREIPNTVDGQLEVHMNTSSCQNNDNAVNFLEHVQAKVTLYFKPRGNLKIMLISPAGTQSIILPVRPHDSYDGSFSNWPFMSVHFWGESPIGLWKLRITNYGSNEAHQPGKLFQWSLVFFGTERQPVNLKQDRSMEYRSPEISHISAYPNYVHQNTLNECIKDVKFQAVIDNHLSCYDLCPEGYYGDIYDYVCQPCHELCLTCFGPSYGNCLSCPRKLFLSKSHCLKLCPEGFYKDFVKQLCLPCSATCLTCHNKPDLCTSCKGGMILHNQTCVTDCPKSTFLQQFVCRTCHSHCVNCYGEGVNECLECRTEFKNYNGACVGDCPYGFHSNNNNICVSCPQYCDICDNNNQCITCKPGFILDSGHCSYEEKCKKGWYDVDNHICTQCYTSHCATCTGPQNTACISCNEGYYWLNSQCVTECPPGFYLYNNQECAQCLHPCKECDLQGKCLSCKTRYLLDGICVGECPSGFYPDVHGQCQLCSSVCSECNGGSDHECTVCHKGYFRLGHSCVLSCPEGYFLHSESQECVACYYSCNSCTGFGPKSCTSCNFNSSIHGVCIPCQDNEYYDKNTQKCQLCYENCETCDGPSEFNCLSCRRPMKLYEANHSCLRCCAADQTNNRLPCCTCSRDLDICVITAEYPRSVKEDSYSMDSSKHETFLHNVGPILVILCTVVVVIFLVVFGVLQMHSHGWCSFFNKHRKYRRIPNPHFAQFDETVALTQSDQLDSEEMFEKA